jgi:formylmethanofuran dehydrogenase subunit C
MLIELERTAETDLGIEVDGIVPDRLLGLRLDEIAGMPVWIGRDKLDLRSAFKIEVTEHFPASENNPITIRWTGDLSNVHLIGAQMKQGKIEIDSSAGRHVGYGMSGGSITVRGSVGDYAGAEMRGGLLEILGDAGDHLGGCHGGNKTGVNRGEILVRGNAGAGVGQRMRRGLIAVQGNVGRLCGWNMLAGSIIVLGDCGTECGTRMVRGTIVQGGDQNAPLLPTFAPGGTLKGGVLAMLEKRLKQLDFESNGLGQYTFYQYHGDHLNGGRGEVFIVEKK